jgi:tetratricopeptide (TPR) repeat protein
VDVIGSPGLTKLIGALTIEECDIPLLDLASDDLGTDDISASDLMDLCGRCDSAQEGNIISRMESWSTRLSTSMKASQTFKDFKKSSHFSLQFELYPFPISSSQPYVVQQQYFSSGSLKSMMSESECKIKLQKLKHMQDTEIIHLVEAMGAIAEELYNHDCYDTAETWFRRVVRAKKLAKWYKPHQTLWACLRVAKCVERQDRYKEAQQLQQGLHDTIERVFGADHDVSIQSLELNAELLGHLGFLAEEEAIHRQALQIRLISLGLRHPRTIYALENLGSTLGRLDRCDEAQQLLEVSLHFRLETVKNSGYSLRSQFDILWDIAVLSEGLRNDGRYDESENVLNVAHNSLADITRLRDWITFEYHYERACTYKLQKRFENSEKILRGLLKYHLNYMAPGTSMESMRELAKILVETGRHREAAYWRKKEYLLHVKIYGLTHHYTIHCCEDVGFGYADQSLYNEGKLFFEKVIKMIDLSSEEPDSRTVCIQNIEGWMEKLEEMRLEDSMERGLETSESVDFEREPIDTDDDIDYEDMGDIPDPLDF